MYSKDFSNEKAHSRLNRENREKIFDDVRKAKESGLSYGHYKAGIVKDDEPSEYTTYSPGFLQKKEPSEAETKPKAHIK